MRHSATKVTRETGVTDVKSEWDVPRNLIREMRRCCSARADIATVAMTFICIDTMASLSMPEGRTKQTRDDFIKWVDRYLKARADQPYQYVGLDLYAARCGLLHGFSPTSSLHNDRSVKRFCYKDGVNHWVVPDSDLVVIATGALVDDTTKAVQKFRRRCRANAELYSLVSTRLLGRYTDIYVTAPIENCPTIRRPPKARVPPPDLGGEDH